MYSYRLVLASLTLAVGTVGMADLPEPADAGIQQQIDQQSNPQSMVPVRASKLIGTEVYNHQDRHLGDVKEIALSSDGQRIGYAVVSRGGAPGMVNTYGGTAGTGDTLCAIPLSALEYPNTAESRVYARLDEQTLRNAPRFDPDYWRSNTDAVTYFRQTDEYYNKTGAARTASARMEADRLASATPMTQDLTWNRRLSSVLGAEVRSPDGQKLGDIKDLVIDWSTGKVQYAVLSFGGVMGFGNKLFAVPSRELTTRPDSKTLVLAIGKARLEAAPGFDKDNWPNFADTNWRKTNDQFYAPQR